MGFVSVIKRGLQIRPLALSVLLALALFAALLPQAALAAPAAATTCTAYHTIRSGDSTVRIAHTYGLTWREIAAANKLAASYTLKVGARLCIPAVSTTSSSSATTGARFTVNLIGSGDRFSITTAGFSGVHKFNVKVRDATASKGTWYVLGRLSTEETSKNRTIFTFPSQLAGRGVAICLKDLTTDDLICNTVSRLAK